ncbi:MAG: hypothetical protein WD334_03840 [Chitinophagales bacterium]
MISNQIKLLFFAFGIFMILVACENTKKKVTDPRVQQMSRAWVYDKVDIEGTVFPGEQMGSPRMIFSEDSTYKMTFQNMADSGKWYFIGDTLVTTTFSNPGEEEYLTIKSLTDSLVVLQGESNGKDLILTMRSLEEEK